MIKLKQLRKSKGISAMELVEKAGLDLTQPLMSACESGKVLFTPEQLDAICEALGCDLSDLFDNATLTTHKNRNENSGSITPARMAFFDEIGRVLPEPNPKRSFRMSDKDWNELKVILKDLEYNSVGHYLHACIHGASYRRKA